MTVRPIHHGGDGKPGLGYVLHARADTIGSAAGPEALRPRPVALVKSKNHHPIPADDLNPTRPADLQVATPARIGMSCASHQAQCRTVKTNRLLDHVILIAGCLFMGLPVLLLALSSTHSPSVIQESGLQPTIGAAGLGAYRDVLLNRDLFGNGVTAADMLVNSFIVAVGFALLKTLISMLAAYALVYFRVRFASLVFGIILLSIFFPIETRVLPTFLVTDQLGLLNSYTGLILPIAASGLGTFLFRQYFQQIPNELLEAARLDNAGPFRFLVDILMPLSAPMVFALFALLFVLGWNQYLWPIMLSTTSEDHYTIVRGMQRFGLQGNAGMALAILAILPPAIVLILAQRWLMRGLNTWWT